MSQSPRDPSSSSKFLGSKDLSSIKAPSIDGIDAPDESARQENQFCDDGKGKLTNAQFQQMLIRRQVEDLTRQRDSFRDELALVSAKFEDVSDRARALEVSLTAKVGVLETELRHAHGYGGLSTFANVVGGVILAIVGLIDLQKWKGAALATGVVLVAIAATLAFREWWSRPKSKPPAVRA